MYAAIRRLKAQPGVFDEVVQRDESGLVPLLRSVSGFVEFVLVQVGEDVGVSISLFETQEQAEEANRRAANWVQQNVVPLVAGPAEIVAVWVQQNVVPLVAGPAEIVAVGEVRLRKGKDTE